MWVWVRNSQPHPCKQPLQNPILGSSKSPIHQTSTLPQHGLCGYRSDEMDRYITSCHLCDPSCHPQGSCHGGGECVSSCVWTEMDRYITSRFPAINPSIASPAPPSPQPMYHTLNPARPGSYNFQRKRDPSRKATNIWLLCVYLVDVVRGSERDFLPSKGRSEEVGGCRLPQAPIKKASHPQGAPRLGEIARAHS